MEVIWPDIPIERADLGFHRTLGGLRRVLQADFGRSNSTATITFHNDRYRLNPAVIDWSDVGEFRELVSKAGRASAPAEVRSALERARSLYRGDYLDDCPFYGDSLYVEERRTLLRGMFVEVLVSLGEMHEAGGDRLGAASCFREELLAADGCRRAEAGLSRLDLAQEH